MTKNKLNLILVSLFLLNLILISLWLTSFFFVRSEYARLVAIGSKLPRAQEGSEAIACLSGSEVKELEDYFVNSSVILKLMDDLKLSSGRSGVALEFGRVDDGKEELRLSLSTKGSYGASASFLKELELMPYALRVERFDIRQDGGVWSGNYLVALLKEK